jgi:hypothetical protein
MAPGPQEFPVAHAQAKTPLCSYSVFDYLGVQLAQSAILLLRVFSSKGKLHVSVLQGWGKSSISMRTDATAPNQSQQQNQHALAKIAF